MAQKVDSTDQLEQTYREYALKLLNDPHASVRVLKSFFAWRDSQPEELVLQRAADLKITAEELDEFVHDLKSEEAASLNNGGIEDQVEYLLASGCTVSDILLKFNEIAAEREEVA